MFKKYFKIFISILFINASFTFPQLNKAIKQAVNPEVKQDISQVSKPKNKQNINQQTNTETGKYLGKAVIKYPIAEMSRHYPVKSNLPASPDTERCNREHQGLYNEIVDVVEYNRNRVKIAYPNMAYDIGRDSNTLWVNKNNIALFKDLNDQIIDLIPSQTYAQETTVILVLPWKDFSVGTRFKYIKDDNTPDIQDTYSIKRYNFISKKTVTDLIPKECAILEANLNSEDKRKLFVKIIETLIEKTSSEGKIVPYVWGGSSFVNPHNKGDFYSKDGVWVRGNKKNNIYTGFDCSELVFRMAQIAGIYFPWKTTWVIEAKQNRLTKDDQLKIGDLIWTPGHVMIISDINNNEIIESRGYTSGYGCLHKISLSECFEDISDYQDLLKKYFSNRQIKYKNKDGKPDDTAKSFKILKLLD